MEDKPINADGKVDISVVIPVYNEQEVLPELYQRLTRAMGRVGKTYEIVLVDDGSEDSSLEILKTLKSQDEHLKIIKLTRNFGRHPAVAAGLRNCEGNAVVLMDADLQNPPEEISKLLDKLYEGYAIVYGIREKRKDPLYRKIGARLYRVLVRRMLGVDDTLTPFMAMRRKVLNSFIQIREQHSYIAALMVWMGYSSAAVPVKHAERFAGKSHYSMRKLTFMTIDMLVGFSYAPLKWASKAGFGLALIGILYGLYVLIRALTGRVGVPGYASIFVGMMFLSGIQMMFLGIIGEYLARIYREIKGRPYYIIDEIL
jgi:glycosyltransferase involved in cell wall biosynthesis